MSGQFLSWQLLCQPVLPTAVAEGEVKENPKGIIDTAEAASSGDKQRYPLVYALLRVKKMIFTLSENRQSNVDQICVINERKTDEREGNS
jgi:hypothetical protein